MKIIETIGGILLSRVDHRLPHFDTMTLPASTPYPRSDSNYRHNLS